MPDLFGKFIVADRHGMGGAGNATAACARIKLDVCFIGGVSIHDSFPSRT